MKTKWCRLRRAVAVLGAPASRFANARGSSQREIGARIAALMHTLSQLCKFHRPAAAAQQQLNSAVNIRRISQLQRMETEWLGNENIYIKEYIIVDDAHRIVHYIPIRTELINVQRLKCALRASEVVLRQRNPPLREPSPNRAFAEKHINSFNNQFLFRLVKFVSMIWNLPLIRTFLNPNRRWIDPIQFAEEIYFIRWRKVSRFAH
jgi:hypothetical protein